MKLFLGSILNPLSDTRCEWLPHGGILVNEEGTNTGKIARILDKKQLAEFAGKLNLKKNSVRVIDYSDSILLPTFFDMHFHWVQDSVRNMPKESLLDWLKHYTFPAEIKFSHASYAKSKAKAFFKRLVRAGTLGGACYSSIHDVALDAAMKHCIGDFVIGNVLMNRESPTELIQSEAESIRSVKRGIKLYKNRYALTPRFAITTSDHVMQMASDLADRAKCFKQTHLSETVDEINTVLSLTGAKSYTEHYKKVGMLGRRSLMGHAIHLSAEEYKQLAKTKTALIHCPTSNAPVSERGLGSGLFDFKKAERFQIRWALGSDIGGGPYLSMFDVMRSFVHQNKKANISGATYVRALYRATLAGAQILECGKFSGNLKVGKNANFMVLEPKLSARVLANRSAEQVLEKLIEPFAKDRSQYDSLPKAVFYKGTQFE